MDEEWVHIPEFPGYMVSNYGQVRKPDDRLLTLSPVQYNIPTVGLRVPDDNRTYRRSVPLLVAEAFVDREHEGFDVPIHLDGDRSNARADNLKWRPRWFAILFHKQCAATKFPNWKAPIVLVETGETFLTIQDACVKYGLLEMSIHTCLWNPDDWVYPYGYHFIYAD